MRVSMDFSKMEVIPSQDMYGDFLPLSEDSASHSRVFVLLSLRDRCEAFLVFCHLLLTKAHPALTVAEQARLKASLYLPGRLCILCSLLT